MENSRARVYVVDDAPDYLFLIEQVFKRFLPQYSAHFFGGGDALLDHLSSATGEAEGRAGLILLDVHMPGRSGLQTLTAIRANPSWRWVPLVMMSNAASPAERDACYEAGASSFITKPIGIEQWQETLNATCHYWLQINQPPSV